MGTWQTTIGSFFRKFLGTLLILLSLPIFLVSFIPILFPLVIVAGGVVLLVSYLVYRTRPSLPDNFTEFKEDFDLKAIRKARQADRAGIAVQISLSGIILSVVLYFLMIGYSYLVYINPLSRDLEPIRKVFRQQGNIQVIDK